MINYKKLIPIEVEEKLWKKKREEGELLAKQGITKKKFRIAVKKKMARKKISFTLAVYQTFDEFLEKEIEKTGVVLACKKGCSDCCYQMITCTEMEIDEIIKFIRESRKEIRRKLMWEVTKGVRNWKRYLEKKAAILRRNSFQALKDWDGRPCPFLNRKEGICNIYPVRIIDCRTSSSLTPHCGSGKKCRIPCELNWQGPGRFRFQCEGWANQMILEEQERKFGHVAPFSILEALSLREMELY